MTARRLAAILAADVVGLSLWAATSKLYFTECGPVHIWSPDFSLSGLTLAKSSLGPEEDK